MARANNFENLKSARSEHINVSVYAEAVKYSAPLFLSFLKNLGNNSDQK